MKEKVVIFDNIDNMIFSTFSKFSKCYLCITSNAVLTTHIELIQYLLIITSYLCLLLHGVAEIAELDIARPDNAAPDQTEVLEHS